MDGSHLNFDSLQLFLSFHSKSATSKVSHIKETLQKAENQHILSSKALLGPLGVRATKSNESDIYTSRSKNKTPCIPSTTLSTSLSPGSIIIDSLTDEDLEKRNSAPDLQVKTPNTARVVSTLTPNKGHVLRKSHFARRHTQCTNSPSNKTDPGNFRKDSFLSTYSQKSCHSRYGSNKSKRYADKEDDNPIAEESESFLMIKPLCPSENSNDPGSPIFERKKLCLGLDEDVFPQSIISYADSLYTTSFSSNMRDLILNTNKDRNKNVEFYAARSKHEALFSVIFKEKARNTFERLLLELSLKLKEESVSFRQKYHGDIEFLEVKMLKAIRAPNASVKFEENELRVMSEKIGVLMNEKCLIESNTHLKLLWNYLQSILSKFEASITAQSAKSEVLVVPEYITLPKLLEKAITCHEDASFYRDVVIYTYDLYISSQNLLLYFISRYFVPTPFNMSRSEKKLFQKRFSNKTKSLILSVIIFWLEEREGDFLRTPSLLTILSAFLEVVQASEKDVEELNKQFQELWKLHEKIARKVIRKENKAQASVILEEEPKTVGSMGCINLKPCSSTPTEAQKTKRKQQRVTKTPGLFSFSKQKSPKVQYTMEKLLEEPTEIIAEQLTLLDWKQFSDIELREVLNKRWTKPEKKECPNYWTHVDRFNSFSFWIQYVILSQGTPKQRMDIAEKFLKVAMICIKNYQNYCSSNYIFSALFSLSNFGVISFEDELKKDYEELNTIFAPNGGYIKLYNDLFRDLKPPAIPNLNVFLRIFLKLQDGVNYWVSLPDSRLKYLKFQSLVQIHDYCKEMKKFQKVNFREISKEVNLYSFLKTGFTEMIPADVVNSEEMMKKITQMVGPVKKNQPKLLKFFGITNN